MLLTDIAIRDDCRNVWYRARGVTTVTSEYQVAASELLRVSPGSKDVMLKANMQLSKGAVYGALREYRKLIDMAQ